MRIISRPDHHSVRNLSEHHIFELQWSVLQAEEGRGQGFTGVPNSDKCVHFEERATREAPHPHTSG